MLALFHHARRLGCGLSVPRLVNFDPSRGRATTLSPFTSVFSGDALQDYADEMGVKLSFSPDYRPLPFADLFNLGGALPKAERFAFLKALRPSAALAYLIADALPRAYPQRQSIALQLRIEKDWHRYHKDYLRQIEGEDNRPDVQSILRKARKLAGSDCIYVTCDEKAIRPKRKTVDKVARNLGIELIWKSDLNLMSLGFAKSTELDFQIALAAQNFIGSCRSTFSNVLASSSAALGQQSRHYLYNANAPEPLLRQDEGIHCTIAQCCPPTERISAKPKAQNPSFIAIS